MSSSTTGLESQTYDFIIVGGGTSGLVVASRLTEDPSVRVLVLEAGANRLNDPRVECLGLASSTYFDPDFDWCMTSVPQPGLDGREICQPAGRTLGGSTAINLGMAIYPSKSGFDAWQKLGNPGWDWDTLSPYFRKFHTLTMPNEKIQEELSIRYLDPTLQGTSGPVQASFGEDWYTPFNKAWPRAFKNLNYEVTGDPISGEMLGAFTNPGMIDPKTKKRSHAGNTYYGDTTAKRSNLRVVTEVLVEKVLTEKKDGSVIATGVAVTTKDGQKLNLSASEEVILAAGALNTPKVLELSGIGGADLLRSHSIDVVIDNKYVGENFQDHGFVPFSWEVADPMTSGDALRQPEVIGGALAAFQNGGAGPLGICSIVSSYMPITDFAEGELDQLLEKYIDNEKTYKDFPSKKIQYELIREILHKPGDASGQYTMAPFQINPPDGPSPKGIYGMQRDGNYMSIVAVLNHPLSRGSVHINSADPSKNPTLDVGFLSHPLDLELHGRHTVWLEKLAQSEPLASLLKKDGRRLHLPNDGPRELDLETGKRLSKERIVSHYHSSGTCAMMPEELGGVVNDRLKVYGTKNLRIVDASIFPMIPRGNIQADVYAIAERAADIIKEDRKAT